MSNRLINNPFNNSGGGGSGGDVPNASATTAGKVKLSNSIDSDSQSTASTPLAVKTALTEAKDYTDKVIDDLESTLIKYSFELRPTVQGQLEFDMPPVYNQNPDYYIDLLYFNSTKVLESKYLIVEKVTGDSNQGFKLVLTSPAPDYNSAIYNLVLIGGKALGVGDLSDSYFHTSSTPPTNTNLIWNKV